MLALILLFAIDGQVAPKVEHYIEKSKDKLIEVNLKDVDLSPQIKNISNTDIKVENYIEKSKDKLIKVNPKDIDLSLKIENISKNLLKTKQTLALIITEDGFIPQYLNLKTNITYKLAIINNTKDAYTSFILDAFSVYESINKYKIKYIEIDPKVEGRYKFISAENNIYGNVIVIRNKTLQTSEYGRF